MKTGHELTPADLAERARRLTAAGWPVSKWIEYAGVMIARGCRVYFYGAAKTKSKYVTAVHGGRQFRVRFSDHKPNRQREIDGDCDFFVGRTHLGWTNTQDAIRAADEFFTRPPSGAQR